MSLRALIFDVDGTLADTEQAGHRVAFNDAFAEAGLPWVWDADRYDELLQVTGGKERMRFYAGDFDPEFLEREDADAVLAGIHAAKTRRYVALVTGGRVPLRPGVETIIREAHAAGLPLAIATTTSPENVTALLATTMGDEVPDWFAVIGAGDVVAEKKPAPDIYEWVIERLGVDPGDCLAIEDSGPGLAAARAADVPTVVTPSAQASDDVFSGAIARYTDLSGLCLDDLRTLHAGTAGTDQT